VSTLESNTIQYPEYELRHQDGEVDEFEDIGDAINFRDNGGYRNAALFRRMVTQIVVKHEWEEIEPAGAAS
jgi:hypothetical protein